MGRSYKTGVVCTINRDYPRWLRSHLTQVKPGNGQTNPIRDCDATDTCRSLSVTDRCGRLSLGYRLLASLGCIEPPQASQDSNDA